MKRYVCQWCGRTLGDPVPHRCKGTLRKRNLKFIDTMSLDLYIRTKRPRTKIGTGVYVRDNGATRELKTLEEVKAYFPGKDLTGISVEAYETNNFWHGNMTHNLGKMASHVQCSARFTLYDLLWRPAEHGFNQVTQEYIDGILEGYMNVKNHKSDLIQYNAPNGWGTYENMINFLRDLASTLIEVERELEVTDETFSIVSDV